MRNLKKFDLTNSHLVWIFVGSVRSFFGSGHLVWIWYW